MSTLSREVYLTQNPALGATLQWRFTVGYQEGRSSRPATPLPLLFLVLPIILHQQTVDILKGTNKPSGLRLFASKFGSSANSKQDVLLGLNERAMQWRLLSLESFRISLATQLTKLNKNGTVAPLSESQPSGSVAASIKPLLAQSEKLGFWCGQLSLHEVSNLLRVSF